MAYISQGKSKKEREKLTQGVISKGLVPVKGTLKNGDEVQLELVNAQSICDKDLKTLQDLLNTEIKNGQHPSYPYSEQLTLDQFKAYFLCADAFIVRLLPTTTTSSNHASSSLQKTNDIVGTFYVKPNYPGRCSHIANSGFIVSQKYRGLGVCRFMQKHYLAIVKALGYKAIMFNLVFVTNKVSLHLWKSMGFSQIGVIPNACAMPDGSYIDAIQFYKALD
mmetsp:Transcript_91/g.106  ORF Transcript_91/g.106 Transcript_91/m.106 type:complete len:221 (-) Transcript_91:34-696(-)